MKHGRFSSICAAALMTAALGAGPVVPAAIGQQKGNAPSQAAQVMKESVGSYQTWGWQVLDSNGNVVAHVDGYHCKGDAVHGLQTYGWDGTWSVIG